MHAAEDNKAGGHEGFQEWKGFKADWTTVKHELQDWFPSPNRVADAYNEDRRILLQYRQLKGQEQVRWWKERHKQ